MDEEDMLFDCMNTNRILSQWEEDFLQSIQERIDDGKSLTPAQHDKLFQIYDRISS